MTSYKFADVVLVPFPFTDQTTSKKRPAVVVSSESCEECFVRNYWSMNNILPSFHFYKEAIALIITSPKKIALPTKKPQKAIALHYSRQQKGADLAIP
jgi:hypothetical protein